MTTEAPVDKYRAIDPNFVAPKTQPDAHRALARTRTTMNGMRRELVAHAETIKGRRIDQEELDLYRERRAQLRGSLLGVERHYSALKLWIKDHYALRPGAQLSGVLVEDLFAELRRRAKAMESVVAAAVTFAQATEIADSDSPDSVHAASRHLATVEARGVLLRAVNEFLGDLPDEAEDDGEEDER